MSDLPDRAAILNQLGAIAAATLGHSGALEEGMTLVEVLRLDSVRRLTLVVEVENHFELMLEPEDEAKLVTVGDLVRLIAEKSPAGSTR